MPKPVPKCGFFQGHQKPRKRSCKENGPKCAHHGPKMCKNAPNYKPDRLDRSEPPRGPLRTRFAPKFLNETNRYVPPKKLFFPIKPHFGTGFGIYGLDTSGHHLGTAPAPLPWNPKPHPHNSPDTPNTPTIAWDLGFMHQTCIGFMVYALNLHVV